MGIPIKIEHSAASNNSSNTQRLLISLGSLFLLCVLTFNLLETQSFRTVDHALHAIEIGDGQFIHGSKLDCTTYAVGQSCNIEIAGKTLRVKIAHFGQAPNTIGDCTSTFDGRNVRCEDSYPTSSYWAHGVRLENTLLESAFASEWQHRLDWRTTLLGMSESGAMAMAGIGAIVLPLLAVFGIPAVVTRFNSQISWTGSASRKYATALVLILIVPTFLILTWTVLVLEFVD